MPENARTCTSVGVETTTVPVDVGVGNTAVFVGVFVGVRVGSTAVFVGVFVGVRVGMTKVPVGVGVGVPCSGASAEAPCRAGCTQDAEGPEGAAELGDGFVLAVREVPATEESTMPPTTAATSTVIPTTLPMATQEYDGAP